MFDLYTHFSQQLQKCTQRHFVLALSGGVDSRVLLSLLRRYQEEAGTSVSAVHVHHGLSTNADHWAECCQRWCDESSVPLTVEHVYLDLASGESVEKLARDARYQVLAKHIREDEVLLLGQHADDQIETFLLALKRGSGPKGLSCMPYCAEFSKGTLLRPLLSVKRSDIEAYAHSHQLSWVSDESNQDTRYERNFLRHHVTPVLSERWPFIHQAVQRSAELCADQESLLCELLQDALNQSVTADGSLSIEDLSRHSEGVRRQLIRQWLASQGFPMPSRKHTAMIWQEVALANQDANPKLNLGEGEIRRYSQRLYLVKAVKDLTDWRREISIEQSLVLPDHLGILLLSSSDGNMRLPENANELWVSFNPEGLSACPEGRVGSRKLKKLFQEYQIPSWRRRRTPILMYQNKVVAVADLFIDRDFTGQDCKLVWDK